MMDGSAQDRRRYKDMVLCTVALETKSGLKCTGKLLSAGPRTIWVHLSGEFGDEDCFVAYDNVVLCEVVS